MTRLACALSGALLGIGGLAVGAARADHAPLPDAVRLAVPALRGTARHCGQTAFRMVLAFYAAPDSAAREGERVYDPALRGTLVTDLAAAARRAGFDAHVAESSTDELVALLASGVPPIVLYQEGRGPVTAPHYGVVTGWDPGREAFLVNDGHAHPVRVGRAALARRWRTAGAQMLVIRPRDSAAQ